MSENHSIVVDTTVVVERPVKAGYDYSFSMPIQDIVVYVDKKKEEPLIGKNIFIVDKKLQHIKEQLEKFLTDTTLVSIRLFNTEDGNKSHFFSYFNNMKHLTTHPAVLGTISTRIQQLYVLHFDELEKSDPINFHIKLHSSPDSRTVIDFEIEFEID